MRLFRLTTVEGSKFWVVFERYKNDLDLPVGFIKASGKSVVTKEQLDLKGFGFLPKEGSKIKVSKGTLSEGMDRGSPALFETINKVTEFPVETLEAVKNECPINPTGC